MVPEKVDDAAAEVDDPLTDTGTLDEVVLEITEEPGAEPLKDD